MARIRLRIQRPWIPYIIFVITLTLTVISTYYVNRATYNEDRLRFLNAVQDTENSIQSRLSSYITLLRGTAGLFAADPTITSQQFTAYVNRLRISQNYPGAQGIGFIQRVSGNEKDAYIQSVRAQDDPQFTISPAGNRSEYYVVRYLTLAHRNTPSIIGHDMATDPIRYGAMERARDLGKTTISKKVILWSKNETQNAGFLIFTPVYTGGDVPATVSERRAKIAGFIYSAFAANQLLVGILDDRMLPQLLNFQIYDGKEMNQANLLQDSRVLTHYTEIDYLPRFHTARAVMIGDETWTINYTNHPQFDIQSQKDLSFFIFIGGLLVSTILFMLSRSQYIARNKAEIAAAELKNSQKELQKAIGLRDNFISIASHELKTPVTSLKVYAEVLLRQFMKKGDTTTTDYLTKIIKQIDKLTLLIQDLLNVSRIQANQLTFRIEKFDLNMLAKEVIDTTQQIADHHHIILEGGANKKVWGDRERISQVFLNLLTNALKYSPKSKKVIVKIQDKKEKAIVSVQDFGIGISTEHQKKIFDRFYRISDTNEQTFPGLGIGLYISQAITKRHGSEISIKSIKGKGATFTFTLPYKKEKIAFNEG